MKKGDVIRFGSARWFEHLSSKKEMFYPGETAIILTEVVRLIGHREMFFAYVLSENAIGSVYLIDWVDEVVG